MSGMPLFSFFDDLDEEYSYDFSQSSSINKDFDKHSGDQDNLSPNGTVDSWPSDFDDSPFNNFFSANPFFSPKSHYTANLEHKTTGSPVKDIFENFSDEYIPENICNHSLDYTKPKSNLLQNFEKSFEEFDFQNSECSTPDDIETEIPKCCLQNSESLLSKDLSKTKQEFVFQNSECSTTDDIETEIPKHCLQNSESLLSKDLSKTETQVPVTLVVKKFKIPQKNIKMVMPYNIPKPNCSLVKIPNQKMTSKKVVFLNFEKYRSSSNAGIAKPTDNEIQNIAHQANNSETPQSQIQNFEKRALRSGNKLKLDPQDLPFTSLKRRYSITNSERPLKKKAYELQPLSDPEMEKCRLNAINAKKNRDIKKAKMITLEAEVEKERNEKLKLAGENETLKQRNEELEDKIKYLRSILQVDNKASLQNSSHMLKDFKELNINVYATEPQEFSSQPS